MIKATTRIIGLLGHPVEHSLSPLMHNGAIKACGLDLCYLAFDVQPEELSSSVEGMVSLGFVGFNVTIPHKERIMNFLDRVDEEARLMGAVNTVVIRNKKTFGYNTDGRGFLKSLREAGVEIKDRDILIVGAGGAARAVAVALALNGAGKITIANRTVGRAQAITRIIQDLGVEGIAVPLEREMMNRELATSSMVINATPVGMGLHKKEDPVIDVSYLKVSAVVCDLVYRPRNTALLQTAEERGCRVVSGLGMLLYQGVEAFKLFTGVEPPIEVMEQMLNVGF